MMVLFHIHDALTTLYKVNSGWSKVLTEHTAWGQKVRYINSVLGTNYPSMDDFYKCPDNCELYKLKIEWYCNFEQHGSFGLLVTNDSTIAQGLHRGNLIDMAESIIDDRKNNRYYFHRYKNAYRIHTVIAAALSYHFGITCEEAIDSIVIFNDQRFNGQRIGKGYGDTKYVKRSLFSPEKVISEELLAMDYELVEDWGANQRCMNVDKLGIYNIEFLCKYLMFELKPHAACSSLNFNTFALSKI